MKRNASIESKKNREKAVVGLMVRLYCGAHHGLSKRSLCEDCRNLLDYATARIDHCPHMATKTFCSNCRTHCYRPDMRERIRLVMRWAGPRMVLYHPIMAIRHVVEMKKERRRLGCS